MTDPLTDPYRWLARYNQWFNQRLYLACEDLSDAQRQEPRGAFFGSIHHTLNHLVLTDQMWLKRMAQQGVAFAALQGDALDLPPQVSLNHVLYADWAALRQRRERLDQTIVDWTQEMPATFPSHTMRYQTTAGVAREHPAWQAISHFFNHQTHHRGQVTTLLHQFGVDVGPTDAIVLADR